MLKNFEQQEEELINMIYTDPKINDVIYLIQEYVNAPTDTNKKDLNKISSEKYNELSNRIYDNLKITLDHNLTRLLSVNQIDFFRTIEIEEYKKYQSTEEYKIYDEFIAPIPYRINDLHFPIVAKEILNYKNIYEVNHYDILIKSLDSAIKYLHKVQADFNLDTETMNYFKHGLFREICRITQGIFNKAEYIEFNKNVKDILTSLHEINKSFFNLDMQGELRERVREDIRLQQCKLDTITSNYNNKIIGFDEVDIIYNITPNNIEFNINELKTIIKSYFNTGDKTDNEKQLEYGLWIMYLKANKESDTLPIEDKFILKNMILPWSKDLRELLGEDFDNTNFNFEEAIKYINRLKTQGEYKNKHYKIKALKKIFEHEQPPSVSNREIAVITPRTYMINDCSAFKSSLYKFLMSEDKTAKDYMPLNKNSKNKNLDLREFYLMSKTNKGVESLSIEHIALLVGLENVFMNCEEHIQSDGTIFLMKSDLMRLFGDNFRGEREEIFLNLIRDMSQILVKVDILRAEKNKSTGKESSNKIGKIEGNLMSFFTMTNKEGDTIYQIKMPFLQELLKRSTRNTLKSIELLKYTFKQPKKVLITEYISNIVFYHRKTSRNTPKKISIKSILDQLGLYDEYKNMSAKACNEYLIRLKKDIIIACELIRNIKTVKFTPMSKSKIDDKSCGFTIYFTEKPLKIED